MAKTTDVIAGRLLPLPAALAYLEQHTKSPAYAELLLTSGLASGLIRYRAHETEVHFPDPRKSPVPGRVLVLPPPHGGAGFWRTNLSPDNPQLKIDWERSEATRIDHAYQTLDGAWQEHRIVCLRGVHVSEDHLKKILQSEQLLPPADVPASPPPTSPLPATASTTATPATMTAKEAARLDPKQWAFHAPARFPEKPKSETRKKYLDRVWMQMRKEKKGEAWSRDYFERRCYELKVLAPRQPRNKPRPNHGKSLTQSDPSLTQD